MTDSLTLFQRVADQCLFGQSVAVVFESLSIYLQKNKLFLRSAPRNVIPRKCVSERMQGVKRGHHIIPKHFLKGFADKYEKQFVWVYTKGKPYRVGKQNVEIFSPCLTSLSVAGKERDYYADKLKDGSFDYESNEIKLEGMEKPAQPIIDKIRHLQQISQAEKDIFSEYIILLWKRGEYHRSDPTKVWTKTMKEEFGRWYTALDEGFAKYENDPEGTLKMEKAKAEIDRLNKLYFEDAHIKKNMLNQTLFQRYNQLTDWLSNMSWTFITNNTASPFITSDAPVYFTNSAGLKKSDLTVALSKNVAIVASKLGIPAGFFPVDEKFVKMINRRSVNLSVKYLFAPIASPWVATMANKGHYSENLLLEF